VAVCTGEHRANHLGLAGECKLKEAIKRMFMGDEIRETEKHAIAHRQKNDTKNTRDKNG